MQRYKIILIPGFGLKKDSMKLMKQEFKTYLNNSEIHALSIMDVLNNNEKAELNENIDICVLHSIAAPLISYQVARNYLQITKIKKIILLDPTIIYSQFSKLLKSLVNTEMSLKTIEKNFKYLEKMQRNESLLKYLDYKPFIEQSFIDYLRWIESCSLPEIKKIMNLNKINLLSTTDTCRVQLKKIFRDEGITLTHLDVESHNPFLTHSRTLCESIIKMSI